MTPCNQCNHNWTTGHDHCEACARERSIDVPFPRFRPSQLARKIAEQVAVVELNRDSEVMK